jgi:hypothetical protein
MHDYADEKRQAFQSWANHITRLVQDQNEGSNVIPLTRADPAFTLPQPADATFGQDRPEVCAMLQKLAQGSRRRHRRSWSR